MIQATLQPLKDLVEEEFIQKSYYNKVVLTLLQKTFDDHLYRSHHLAYCEWLDQYYVLITDPFTMYHYHFNNDWLQILYLHGFKITIFEWTILFAR